MRGCAGLTGRGHEGLSRVDKEELTGLSSESYSSVCSLSHKAASPWGTGPFRNDQGSEVSGCTADSEQASYVASRDSRDSAAVDNLPSFTQLTPCPSRSPNSLTTCVPHRSKAEGKDLGLLSDLTHSSEVSMCLAVPSMVLQYSVANLVMSWSNVALLSPTGSP